MNLNKIRNLIPDKIYLKHKYRKYIGKKLDLKNPKTFNEKLNWLKLYDRKDIYTTMVDKYEAKKYVANIIGEKYIIPTIGVYDNFDEIDFGELPDQFVIKCTHDSGGLVIVKDKSKLNLEETKQKINNCLKRNFYYAGREWPYKNIKPRIIIEKYMKDENNNEIRDYKFFCFDGVPKIMYISDESHTDNQKIAFFDINYNQLDIKRWDYKDYKQIPNKPKNFEKMKKFAAILSRDISHLRVDFYEINGNLYFGELTFCTNAGFVPFEDEKWDEKLGELIKLPSSNGVENNEK